MSNSQHPSIHHHKIRHTKQEDITSFIHITYWYVDFTTTGSNTSMTCACTLELCPPNMDLLVLPLLVLVKEMCLSQPGSFDQIQPHPLRLYVPSFMTKLHPSWKQNFPNYMGTAITIPPRNSKFSHLPIFFEIFYFARWARFLSSHGRHSRIMRAK